MKHCPVTRDLNNHLNDLDKAETIYRRAYQLAQSAIYNIEGINDILSQDAEAHGDLERELATIIYSNTDKHALIELIPTGESTQSETDNFIRHIFCRGYAKPRCDARAIDAIFISWLDTPSGEKFIESKMVMN